MGIYREALIKLGKSVADFNNFTILLIAIFFSVLCFGFAVVDMVAPAEAVKTKISGMLVGLVFFFVIFGWWKKFTFPFRIISLLLVIFTVFSVYYNIGWLYSHWHLLFRK